MNLAIALLLSLQAQATEDEVYPILRIPIPPGIVLEAGGIELMPDGRLAVATRRGDIYMIEGAFQNPPKEVKFTLWAGGLHEVLGIVHRDGWLWVTQRCEVTKIRDADGDGRADTFRTVSDAWGITGDYHEYAFGSRFDREGNLWVVLCLTGSFTSDAPFRGWCVRITPDGKMIPTTSGIRSPGGMGMNAEGDVFYCDNQGPWNGTSAMKHLKIGAFVGHPGGNKWYPLAGNAMGPRPPDPKSGSRFHLEVEKIPEYVPPAILLPHGKMGNSASGIVCDETGGKFGPFQKQLFASDQSHSVVNRIFLEKLNGVYQGAAFPFRKGFGSGNVPMLMTSDSIVVGGTNRGWGSRGNLPFALERLVWSGQAPFEVHEMRIRPDGFELLFTRPADRAAAGDPASYTLKTFTYIFQSAYGSPEVDPAPGAVKSVMVSADGLRARLVVEGLRIGSIHDLQMAGVRSASGEKLLHDQAYYTLWNLPK